MRIVIDLQACQTASRHRGIGRYSLQLTKALIEIGSKHEIILVANGGRPSEYQDIRKEFSSVLPLSQIRAWQCPEPPLGYHNTTELWRSRVAQLVRERFIAGLKPDAFLATSLFEDDVCTTIGSIADCSLTGAIFYDLTPLRLSSIYLATEQFRIWYREKIHHLKRAEWAFAISESTRQDGIKMLGLSPDRIVNISAGVDARFAPSNLGPQDIADIRVGLSAPDGFVLYYGGFYPHKNVARLIQAFALLPPVLRRARPLVLVGNPRNTSLEQEVADLGLTASDVRFVARVEDNELIRLIAAASVVVFPSIWEGFGLPVLEAMSVGSAVLCSNLSSLPEVIGRTDAVFDPTDPKAIAEVLTRVLTDDAFNAELRDWGRERAASFSWAHSAQKLLEVFENSNAIPKSVLPRRRLAWLSDAIVDSPRLSAPSALAAHYEIDVYSDACVAAGLAFGGHPATGATAYAPGSSNYDRIVIDSSSPPAWAYEAAHLVLGRAGEAVGPAGEERPMCIGVLPPPPQNGSWKAMPEWASAAARQLEQTHEGPASIFASVRDLAHIVPNNAPTTFVERMISALVANTPKTGKRRLLLDIGSLQAFSSGGIPRVVERIITFLCRIAPKDVEILPVELDLANQQMLLATQLLGQHLTSNAMSGYPDGEIEPCPGDIFVGLALNHNLAMSAGFAQRMREVGGRLSCIVYDLLPISRPDWFPTALADGHEKWFRAVSEWDQLICISQSVERETAAQLDRLHVDQRPAITWFHLGSDLPIEAPERVFLEFGDRPSLLHVSQVWLRKGHSQTLAAFENLWASGRQVNYVIAGRIGYGTGEFVQQVLAHPELNRRLHFINDPDDFTLAQLYRAAAGVIVPSEAEGFGLPVVEAVRFRRPLLCRDIPVFREIVGESVRYFEGLDAASLSAAIDAWLPAVTSGEATLVSCENIISWEDAARALLDRLDIPDPRSQRYSFNPHAPDDIEFSCTSRPSLS